MQLGTGGKEHNTQHNQTMKHIRTQVHTGESNVTDTLVSTLPPDADYLRHLSTLVFWNREQPQLFTRCLDLNVCKHLGKNVGSHLSSRDVVRCQTNFQSMLK
jgi:hypothetical protein